MFAIKKISWLMLVKEIVAFYRENHKEPIKTLHEQKRGIGY
jgi:hypothetical protein